MNKEFIPYEQALALKELGFDEECFWWYDFEKQLRKDIHGFNTNSKYFMEGSSCSAPLYQQVFRWFREKYNWQFIIQATKDQHSHELGYSYWIWNSKTSEEHYMQKNKPSGDWCFKTYIT
jgi:hypothetical protein